MGPHRERKVKAAVMRGRTGCSDQSRRGDDGAGVAPGDRCSIDLFALVGEIPIADL